MLLTGTYGRSIDEKLRVAVPKRLREAMAVRDGGVVYIAPGTDGSLGIFPEETFHRWADRLAQSPPTRQEVRAFLRLFYAQAQQVELDRQGRVRIPPELATLAKLEKEVVLVGVQDHLELWSEPTWKSYLAERQPQYDQIAEKALM
ncbi:MAG: division/cell wall cluster transcriptional repressor MraZ [Pirellulales bacterium]|nr:division/cell wall cluster transcriptional repressor MraZ [Pirellulales bacterium]